jgi:signal transduction histidine kinase
MNFRTELDDSFSVRSNEETVVRILEKIIDNAMKFTEQGSVTIEARRTKKFVEISVTDTGIGIPADKQSSIFDNFVKLDEFKGGVGLGLSISKRLTNSLGGILFLDPTYQTGCRFVLQLPIL